MFSVQVTQDEHNRAFDWLENNLMAKIFVFDCDDVSTMVEQIIGGGK